MAEMAVSKMAYTSVEEAARRIRSGDPWVELHASGVTHGEIEPHQVELLGNAVNDGGSRTLTGLDLVEVSLCAAGMDVLSSGLASAAALTRFRLKLSHKSEWSAARRLGAVLAALPALTDLTLENLPGSVLEPLRERLVQNATPLRRLCLFSVGTVPEFVAEVVRANTTLIALEMPGCFPKYYRDHRSSCPGFGDALVNNRTLARLDISGLLIDDEGAAQLSEGLKGNQALEALAVNASTLTHVGLEHFADALESNKRLYKLELSKSCGPEEQEVLDTIRQRLADNEPAKALQVKVEKVPYTSKVKLTFYTIGGAEVVRLELPSNFRASELSREVKGRVGNMLLRLVLPKGLLVHANGRLVQHDGRPADEQGVQLWKLC